MLPEYNKPKGMSDLVKEKMDNLKRYKMAEGGEVESSDEMSEYETVAAEILLAIDKRDPKLLVKGLHALYEMYDSAGDQEEEKGPGALLITGEI